MIKDTPFAVTELKAKRRYEITKGRRNFEVRRIEAAVYAEQLYEVQISAFQEYPEKYRPSVEHDSFMNSIAQWNGTTLGAFYRGDEEETEGRLCGYCRIFENKNCLEYSVHKAIPQYEKKGVNFALIDGALSCYEMKLSQGFYFSNGQRSINHETAFNELLETYFGWRKAYCQLHITYRPSVKLIVKMLYPFRRMMTMYDNVGFVHKINGIMKMEEVARSFGG